jgi:hypothetical protein
VRTDVTDSSLMEFKRELDLIRDSLVAPVELTRAQAYLALGLPADFETTGQMADQSRSGSGRSCFTVQFTSHVA